MPLHPKAVEFIEELAASGAPGWNELPPVEGREIFNGFTEFFGVGPDLDRVEDTTTDQGLPLRIFRPSTPSLSSRHSSTSEHSGEQRLPGGVVFFHGGGWVLGNVETHDTLCRHLAYFSNRVIISVDYRLAPEHPYPAAFEDAYAATNFVTDQAAKFGIDSNHISVAGDSAGGNLAAAVALKAKQDRGPRLESQVLIYPVVEPNFETRSYQAFAEDYVLTRASMEWFWQQYVPQLRSGTENCELPFAALMNADLSGMPPTYLLTAEYDVLRDEGEEFADRLAAAGVPLERKRFDGMLHGFVHFSGIYEDGIRALEEIGAFLRR